MIIYTIGHSNRSLADFIRILRRYGIDLVVDVRRFPTSKKYPYFSRESLSETLQREGIDYIWLGDMLGGYREGGYRKYMETDAFREGIGRLLSLAHGRRAAVMCAEKLWFRCHRRFIADALVSIGHRVIHIVDAGKTYEHKAKSKA